MNNSIKQELKFIYWFAYYNTDSPSVRYRGQYPLEFLKTNFGINSAFVTPGYHPAKMLHFIRVYLSALLFRKKDSMIVIQRVQSSFLYAGLLQFLIRLRPSNTYYDLDDADYIDYPSKSIYHFVKNCSGVFAGSRELVKNLSSYNSNILLNTSPVPDPYLVKKEKNTILTIGWIGDFADGHKAALLKYLFPALRNLDFKARLILLGVGRKNTRDFDFIFNYFSQSPNLEIIIPTDIDWKNEREIQERIAAFDIGIATLLNNEVHRSKSAFKLKQYMNNGVPVLSTDLPENNFFLKDGINGFFCSIPEQFRQRIQEFHCMKESDYRIFSARASESVSDFNMKVYCKTLLTGKGQPIQQGTDLASPSIKHGALNPEIS